MAKMRTVLHLEADVPGMTKDQLPVAEKAMRDPSYMAKVTEAINTIAKEHARSMGLPDNFLITGDIHAVTHHD